MASKRKQKAQRAAAAAGFAENVRARRQHLGLTLADVAEKSGVSRAMLSEIESGDKTPTIAVASQITDALGVNLSELLGIQSRPAEIIRRRDRHVLTDASGVRREVLSSLSIARGIEILWYVLPRGKSTGSFPPHRAGWFEHLTVISGQLHARIGPADHDLAAGDSASYAGDVDHEFTNTGSAACNFLVVVHYP